MNGLPSFFQSLDLFPLPFMTLQGPCRGFDAGAALAYPRGMALVLAIALALATGAPTGGSAAAVAGPDSSAVSSGAGRLLASARHAERVGRLGDALALYRAFLKRNPLGPVARGVRRTIARIERTLSPRPRHRRVASRAAAAPLPAPPAELTPEPLVGPARAVPPPPVAASPAAPAAPPAPVVTARATPAPPSPAPAEDLGPPEEKTLAASPPAAEAAAPRANSPWLIGAGAAVLAAAILPAYEGGFALDSLGIANGNAGRATSNARNAYTAEIGRYTDAGIFWIATSALLAVGGTWMLVTGLKGPGGTKDESVSVAPVPGGGVALWQGSM